MPSAPRGWNGACSQVRANISYEPPLLAAAKLGAGPGGKPTYTLPPLLPHSPAARRAVPLPLGGFTDAPPPEANLHAKMGAPGMGPAPWIEALSPIRKHSASRIANRVAFAPGVQQPASPNGAAVAAALGAAGGGLYGGVAVGGARARCAARGNLRQPRFGEADGFGGVDGAYAEAAGGGYAQAPPLPSGASADRLPPPAAPPPPAPVQQTVSFAPRVPDKTSAAAESATKRKVAAAKTAAANAAAAKAPELVLAERARERVRARREARAKSEAPP